MEHFTDNDGVAWNYNPGWQDATPQGVQPQYPVPTGQAPQVPGPGYAEDASLLVEGLNVSQGPPQQAPPPPPQPPLSLDLTIATLLESVSAIGQGTQIF